MPQMPEMQRTQIDGDGSRPRTLFEKIWDDHVVLTLDSGDSLLYVDRHLIHEGSANAFDRLNEDGLRVAEPALTLGTADHYVPTDGARVADAGIRGMVEQFESNIAAHGIAGFTVGSPDQGIVHVVGPELGFTLPGALLVCGDSHTSTHGALGALAFGIGASEAAHVLATQTIWQRRPKTMRISIAGRRGAGVEAKDVILATIGTIGTDGATQHVIEYAGPVIDAMSIEERLTVCNMSIEAGARAGLVAPDETTLAYVRGRRFAPRGAMLDRAVAAWRGLRTDAGAAYDRSVEIDGSKLEPMVTWGTSPGMVAPIGARVPDPGALASSKQTDAAVRALDYMGLLPGTKLTDVPIDIVFIGSCTNSRIEDLRRAASIARGRRARVQTVVSPGSAAVARQAEAEGLDRIFIDAGFEWRRPGCSYCVGMNGDLVGAGRRSVSTSNRNFVGRQGKGARTHLASPTTAAASAIAGRIADPRDYVRA
ncbi:MAG: 3-isopropylmalate dehydratase large subunit [Alphaproteobacteria bacterium]